MGRRMQRIVGLGLDGSRVLQVENKDPKSAEDGQELRERGERFGSTSDQKTT